MEAGDPAVGQANQGPGGGVHTPPSFLVEKKKQREGDKGQIFDWAEM